MIVLILLSRPKKTWTGTVGNYFKELKLTEEIAKNGTEWKCKIHIADLGY